MNYAIEKNRQLFKAIVGDTTYRPLNNYNFQKKEKILKYLKAKYMLTAKEFSEQHKVKFVDYDPEFFSRDLSDEELRDAILKGKSQIEAA